MDENKLAKRLVVINQNIASTTPGTMRMMLMMMILLRFGFGFTSMSHPNE